jgi:hypothetical protein
LINNRQNGRRRGRGGQQARNGQPGGPDRGNRLDNRARGNAAQLLEKYKTLARDAQMQGDRVNTEYYLQFADHYFRVLSENRARFEEQRPVRQNDNRDDFGGDDDSGDQRSYQGRDDQGDDGWDDGDQQPQAEPQRNYAPRQERQPYQGESNGDAPREANRERGRRNGNSGNGNGHANGNGNGFAAPDFLNEPLSPRFDLGGESDEAQASGDDAGQNEEAPKRRRTRRPRGETSPAEA